MLKNFLFTVLVAVVITLTINALIFICCKKENPPSLKEIIKIENPTDLSGITSNREEIERIKSKILYMEGKTAIIESSLTSLQSIQRKTSESISEMQEDFDKKVANLDKKTSAENVKLNSKIDSTDTLLNATVEDLDKAKSDIVRNKECIDNLVKVLEIQKQALSETKDKVNRITRMFYNFDQVQSTLDKDQK